MLCSNPLLCFAVIMQLLCMSAIFYIVTDYVKYFKDFIFLKSFPDIYLTSQLCFRAYR